MIPGPVNRQSETKTEIMCAHVWKNVLLPPYKTDLPLLILAIIKAPGTFPFRSRQSRAAGPNWTWAEVQFGWSCFIVDRVWTEPQTGVVLLKTNKHTIDISSLLVVYI